MANAAADPADVPVTNLQPYVRNSGLIVHMFQPTQTQVITPEQLTAWEQMMATRVGTPLKAEMVKGETICGCGGVHGGWDDCDFSDK